MTYTKTHPALEALRDIFSLSGQTLLGEDSVHLMGDHATRYHEQGAATAFIQAAELARAAVPHLEALLAERDDLLAALEHIVVYGLDTPCVDPRSRVNDVHTFSGRTLATAAIAKAKNRNSTN